MQNSWSIVSRFTASLLLLYCRCGYKGVTCTLTPSSTSRRRFPFPRWIHSSIFLMLIYHGVNNIRTKKHGFAKVMRRDGAWCGQRGGRGRQSRSLLMQLTFMYEIYSLNTTLSTFSGNVRACPPFATSTNCSRTIDTPPTGPRCLLSNFHPVTVQMPIQHAARKHAAVYFAVARPSGAVQARTKATPRAVHPVDAA